MKLLAIEMSRVTALFQATRPKGQFYLPYFAAKVAERYRFGSAPQTIAELERPKIEFRHGLFEDSAIETFEVYNDGIIVTSRSDTDFIDAFIDDLATWLTNDHGLFIIETHTVRQMYDSSLLVETDRNVFQPFESYAEILQLIEKSLKESSGLGVEFQNYGFTLAGTSLTRKTVLAMHNRVSAGIRLSCLCKHRDPGPCRAARTPSPAVRSAPRPAGTGCRTVREGRRSSASACRGRKEAS